MGTNGDRILESSVTKPTDESSYPGGSAAQVTHEPNYISSWEKATKMLMFISSKVLSSYPQMRLV